MSIRHWSAHLAALFTITLLALPQAAAQSRLEVDCEAGWTHHVAAGGVAFLVIHRGALVCERYDRGVDPEDSWWLASGTKSFAPVMVALAVQDGLLELDQPVSDVLEEWAGDPDRSAVTIRHLLDQSSGLAVNVRNRRLPSYQRAIATRQEFEPGERFRYGAAHFEVLGEVLRRQLAANDLDPTPADYLLRRFLRPLGIGIDAWRAVDGQPAMSEGARMSALDWGRFGQAVLAQGRFGDVVLGDEGVWAAMFEPGTANPGYGLGWWLIDPEAGGWSRPFVAVAAGAGGQRLYIIPDMDLVVVRMTRGVVDDRATREQDWSDRAFLRRLIIAPAPRLDD